MGCGVLLGSLSVASSDLTSLDALAPSKLRVVEGNLNVANNAALANIDGLLGLRRVEALLVIVNDSALVGLAGLGALETVGSQLVL